MIKIQSEFNKINIKFIHKFKYYTLNKKSAYTVS